MANTGIKRAAAVFLTHSTGTDIDGTALGDTGAAVLSDVESMDLLVTTELQLVLLAGGSGAIDGDVVIEILRDVQGTEQDSVADKVFEQRVLQADIVLNDTYRVAFSLSAMDYNQFYVRTQNNNTGVNFTLTYKQVKGDVPVAS